MFYSAQDSLLPQRVFFSKVSIVLKLIRVWTGLFVGHEFWWQTEL